jgi:hypothetical protein
MDPAPPIRVNRAPVLTLWATVVVERLVEHVERSGYVVMHRLNPTCAVRGGCLLYHA